MRIDNDYSSGPSSRESRFEFDTENITKYSKPFLDSLFISSKKIENELSLFSTEDQKNIEINLKNGSDGIDLNIFQERVFDGILYKFSKFGYPSFVEMTKSEFFELAGVKRLLTGRGKYEFPGYETQKLLEGLKKLNNTKYPIILKSFLKYDIAKKKSLFNERRVTKTLISLDWTYKEVGSCTLLESRHELPQGNGQEQTNFKFSHWRIHLNDLVKADNNNFRILPHNIYGKIKKHKHFNRVDTSRRIRITQAEILFIKWLHKHGKGKKEIRINWLNLARDMKFSKLLEKKEDSRIKENISNLCQLAKELHYLEDYSLNEHTLYTEDNTVIVLHLNPESFYHLTKLRNK